VGILLIVLLLGVLIGLCLRGDPAPRAGHGYRPKGPSVDWANVRLPTGGSAIKPPPPQVVRIEYTETRG
jgi:hypothetical protein